MGHLLLLSAGLLLIYMTLAYLLARLRRRLDTVDTAWAFGFILVALSAKFHTPTNLTRLIALLVLIWGLRLAFHIWTRAQKRGEDPRYQELAKKWGNSIWVRAYLSIFLLQGVLIWTISLPIILAANYHMQTLNWLSIVGGGVWLIGYLVEATADRQLANFLKDKSRPKVMQTGLWRYSRHPNYFGELTQWWAIGLIACQASHGWLGLIGPLTLSMLIIFVSGIPPIEKRRLKDPDYRVYQRRTSPLIPWPPRA